MGILKKIYSKVYYYFPFLVKPIEYLYYYKNNIITNKKKCEKTIYEGHEILEKNILDNNYYYVIIDKGIGDLIAVASYAYCLKKKYKRDIAFIVNKNYVDIAKKFDYIKKVIGCTKLELQKIELYITQNNLYETDKYKYCFFEMKVAKNGKRNWSSAKWDKKLFLSERYKKNVFNLNDDVKMYKVKNKYNKKVYSEVMKKYKIKENSILIIPYANTVSNINIKLWIKLVEKLKQLGYVVYTNIGNPRTEKPICGTEGLNLSFDELFNSTVAFRNIVSIRCGLAEYVALSNSKLIVLNDSIKNYDRWDDINVYSKDNLVKNLYLDNKKIDKIIDEIIEEV